MEVVIRTNGKNEHNKQMQSDAAKAATLIWALGIVINVRILSLLLISTTSIFRCTERMSIMGENLNPLITMNFTETFPGIYWISDWSVDETYPNGYRYKILSSVNEDSGLADLVVIIEEKDGSKTEMKRLEVSASALERTGKIFVDGLEEEFGLDFQAQDYRHVRTAEEFESETRKNGWRADDA